MSILAALRLGSKARVQHGVSFGLESYKPNGSLSTHVSDPVVISLFKGLKYCPAVGHREALNLALAQVIFRTSSVVLTSG